MPRPSAGSATGGRGLFAVALVLAVVLVSVGLAAVLYAPPPRPLPSLFGYDGKQAQDLLRREGFDVQLRPARACEPQDLVLGTTPRVGDVLPHGSAVTVRTAVPTDGDCLVHYQDRSDAWAFVAWAEGIGPAPELTDRVEVVVDGKTGASLDAVRRLVADTASRPAPTRNGMPSLDVTRSVPPPTYCGFAPPADTAGRESLRLAVDPARRRRDLRLPADARPLPHRRRDRHGRRLHSGRLRAVRFEEYVAARRTRLVEHAVTLGVGEDDAPALVDATLERHRRQVQRAEDPDPLMYDAVARAAAPAPNRPRSRRPWVAAAVVAVAVGATAAWQLLGSSPAGGARADAGSTVEVRTAVSPGDECRDLSERTAAWAFVAFARGGPAPDFADTVDIVVDGSEPTTLIEGTAADGVRWGGLLDEVGAAFAAPPGKGTRTPRLVVRLGTPPARQCGTARPLQGGEREALRLQVQPDSAHLLACPLTVDLLRSSDGAIDSVVAYSADRDGGALPS